jgi:5-methylthioadenosine/S-adenosylhomocysteine deaminase
LGAASLAASPLLAATEAPAQAGRATASTSPGLPSRGEFVLRNAYLMTMDPALGDIPAGAVHVKNGDILAVGKDVQAPGASVLRGDNMIVLPGLVETHWHMWNTLFRSFSGDSQDQGYFPTVARFGEQMTPEDMYRSTRLAAAEAINSGTTTVHDWCHNVRSRAHAEADIKALSDAGLRARFSCGWAQGLPDTQICDLALLRALHRDWPSLAGDGLVTLGFGWRGKFRAGPIPSEVYLAEFDTARELGLPITAHIGAAHRARGQIEAHAREGLLGKDVQIVHALSATPEEIQMVKEAGASASLSPGSELRIGFGFTPTGEFLAAGVPLGLSVDTAALTGSANFFPVLKLARDLENAKAESEFKMTARRALELGTIDGARSLGLDRHIGSLTPGKRADLIMVSTDALNMAVFTDPAHLVLECTQPENVDTVVVDGRILKRGGKLTSLAPAAVIREARAALDDVRRRTDWR